MHHREDKCVYLVVVLVVQREHLLWQMLNCWYNKKSVFNLARNGCGLSRELYKFTFELHESLRLLLNKQINK